MINNCIKCDDEEFNDLMHDGDKLQLIEHIMNIRKHSAKYQVMKNVDNVQINEYKFKNGINKVIIGCVDSSVSKIYLVALYRQSNNTDSYKYIGLLNTANWSKLNI